MCIGSINNFSIEVASFIAAGTVTLSDRRNLKITFRFMKNLGGSIDVAQDSPGEVALDKYELRMVY